MTDDAPGAPPALGPCCICLKAPATLIVLLDRVAAVPGHGWGCLECGLPPDGACAVLCLGCIDGYVHGGELHEVCRGYPETDGRMRFTELPATRFQHDLAVHAAQDQAINDLSRE
jgi:hypothetical protein